MEIRTSVAGRETRNGRLQVTKEKLALGVARALNNADDFISGLNELLDWK